MTTLLTRPGKTPKGQTSALVVGLPQVNLLPPEVRAARSLAVVKRWLAIGLVGVLLLIGVVYAIAVIVRSNANSDLANAQAETVNLQHKEAKYADVPKVLSSITTSQNALLAGSAGEILWQPYIDAFTAVLPAGVSIDTFTVNGPSPLVAAAAPTNPLAKPSIGSITFTGRSTTVPNTAGWLDALAGVPGFVDPWVSSVAATSDDSGSYYTVSSTVQLTDAAVAHRFVPTEGTK